MSTVRCCVAWWVVLFSLLVASVAQDLPAQQRSDLLHVDEAHIRFHLLPQSELELPFINASERPLDGNFQVDLLYLDGTVHSSIKGAFHEERGTTIEKIAWDLKGISSRSPSDLGWYRLRYLLTPKEPDNFGPVQGTVQLGPLISDAFQMRVTAAASVGFGAKYPVHLRVDEPASGRPCAKVPVEVKLYVDGAVKNSTQVVTDESGYATAVFDLPGSLSSRSGAVAATAQLGTFSEQQFVYFTFARRSTLSITTDKPLYQPGQAVHLRVLAFGPNKRAWKDAKVTVSIKDQEGTELFHKALVTSEFGVATAEWDTPLKVRLGDYSIQAQTESLPDHDQIQAQSQVRLSRYDLPGFTVTATPDRSYYLPGQDASIEVRADYLFGKPLQRARVKVVRMGNRYWAFRDQRWVTDESEPVENVLDSTGKSIVKISLKESFPNVNYQRFWDLPMAAYVTDLSTGRTEQRRFTFRLSPQPIHLYLLPAGQVSADAPLQLYVTSSYADGSPASVTGTVEAARPNDAEDFDPHPDSAHRRFIGKFRTNQYGVGRLELPPLAEDLLLVNSYDQFQSQAWYETYGRRQNGMDYDYQPYVQRAALLLLRASDYEGREGSHTERLQVQPPGDYILVRADRTLYHPGEPIHIAIATNCKVNDMVVTVSTESGLLVSQVVHPEHGRAELAVPYDPRFRGELQIAAYAVTNTQDASRGYYSGPNSAFRGIVQVIYPMTHELQVGLHLVRTTFRPGETATGDLSVRTPDGEAAESVLGVLVFDRAVAERFRTDEEFGRGFGFSVFDYFDPYYQNSLAGVSYRSLLNLDSSKRFPEGLDLAAEAIMRSGWSSWNYNYWSWNSWRTQVTSARSGPDYSREAHVSFRASIDGAMNKVQEALNKIYKARSDYPKTEDQFRAELKEAGIDPDTIRDPWDIAYRPVFSVRGMFDVLSLVSNGIDKKPGTDDDLTVRRFYWPYFGRVGQAMDQAVVEYHARTGQYIRDYPTLRAELKTRNIDLDSQRDPWGSPYSYEFEITGPYFEIHVTSPGPDKRFNSPTKRSWDDVQEWVSRTHYFLDESADLDRALAQHFAETGSFPRTEEELRPVLKAAKLTPDQLLDPWGHPYYFEFPNQSRYWDRIQTRVYSAEGDRQRKTTEVTPVTQDVAYIQILSRGVPGKQGFFPVAEFSKVLTEQSSKELTAVPTPKEPPRSAGTGGISGVVTDPQGAVIVGVQVVAISASKQKYTATTDTTGSFSFPSLPVGTYRLEFTIQGFQQCVVLSVPAKQAGSTKVDASLRIGNANQTVEVMGMAAMVTEMNVSSFGPSYGRNMGAVVDTMNVISGQNNNDQRIDGQNMGRPSAKPLFTPHVRQYFPETMLWRPEVITDKRGEAHISFPMGDTITAWKMSVVASTESGQIGVAEKELRTFQPFFIEHDPPKVLTQGDRISLPVVLRNYSDKIQSVLAELKPEDWFSILSAHRQNVTVAPNSDASAIFSFQAAASIRHGKQQVTARNTATGDTVEREVLVHPDGEEISFSLAKVLAAEDNSLQVQIPDNAIPGWNDTELRVYPNLMAHVLDAMRGIGSRPTGCGEQITSVGYINLLALQLLKKAGQDNSNAGNPRASIARDARLSVQEAYDQLTGAQMPDGGYAYWRVKSDVALTAYVLRFLTAAGEFVRVDPSRVDRARKYLTAHQAKSGAWLRYDWSKEADVEDANLTAYVTRALALAAASAKGKEREEAEPSLKLALEYLEDEIGSWRDPYLVGNYALAAAVTGRNEYIARAQSLLSSLAHNEGPTTYWNLEANTSPFYGWGVAGRLETTALAVEALAVLRNKAAASNTTEQVGRGLQYLLGHKDRYAVWYSTQATQNVLEAMIAALPPTQEQPSAGEASVVVNGRAVSSIQLPSGDTLVGPAVFELGQYLQKGANQVQIVRQGGLSAVNAAVLTSYYIPWSQSSATLEQGVQHGDTRALRLKVSFDHPDAKVDEPVLCTVQTERIGFKGYGMMMAEIGLPPGVDVDRDSLEAARQFSGVYGYEVQPDRVVFYVWPSAGGSQFTFKFRPRYRMEAMATQSVIYDYYNPEARATVVPVRFTAH